MEQIKDDNSYYSELHNSLRGYDTQLWATPPIFITLVGFIYTNLDMLNPLRVSNFILLAVGTLFEVLLIIIFYKSHFYLLSNQKKINEYDEEWNKHQDASKRLIQRIPTHSMTSLELEARFESLEKSRISFTNRQKNLIRLRVSSLTKTIMWLIVLIQCGFVVWRVWYSIYQ